MKISLPQEGKLAILVSKGEVMIKLKIRFLIGVGIILVGKLHCATQPAITVQNGIKRKDLGYYKFFSTHYPAEFHLKVNGTVIEPGKAATVSDSHLVVQYDYVWKTVVGTRTGTKQVEFKVPENSTDPVSVNFNGWDKNERIKVSNAEKVSPEISLESSGDLDVKATRKKRTKK